MNAKPPLFKRLLQLYFDLPIHLKFILIPFFTLVGLLTISGYYLYSAFRLKQTLAAPGNIDGNPAVQQALYLIDISIANGAFLICGFFFFLVIVILISAKKLVSFLTNMQKSLTSIQSSSMALGDYDSLFPATVMSNDEIGRIAQTINTIISDNHGVIRFRRTIEADGTTTEVYDRLANLFRYELLLELFTIWDIDQQTLELKRVVTSPKEQSDQVCQLNTASDCRACRTGKPVTSSHESNICPAFPLEKTITHTCIPLITGGQVIGVVQFLFQPDDSNDYLKDHELPINKAKHYLEETLPVLQAKRLTGYLRDLTIRDSLTGLYNRRFLEGNTAHLVASIKRRQSAMSIIMCDIDFFKQVNDEYNHTVGDQVLVQLSELLHESIRESDIAIRYGGEEFLIMLIDCKKKEGFMVAEKIRKRTESYTFHAEDYRLHSTISLGVSEFPSDAVSFQECIKFADLALYRAKDQGRNRTLAFEPYMWQT